MAIHIEAQDSSELKQIRAREIQVESVQKLNDITDSIENINVDNIESTTNDIKNIVENNLEAQPNLDELLTSINKIAQGVTDIKRNQTNLNKKINDIQDTVDQINGDNNG